MTNKVRNAFVIKADIGDLDTSLFAFTAQKTMYGGRDVQTGDVIFLFASENQGGLGLFARGVVRESAAVAKKQGVARQTPRVSLSIEPSARAKKPLGRAQLRSFVDWGDGRPETELNFKLYRQATNKVVGLTEVATAFLEAYF